jgi:ribose-phosphate pyrophosphokinase
MAETLNLVNPNEVLSFKYEISRFPDGQQSFRLVEDGYNTFETLKTSSIVIKSRFNSFEDLELIICATQALREVGVKDISLYIPYCLGGRSDRKFSDGGINYIKHVIAPIINLQNYTKVIILDPHSDVLEACINNFKKKDTSDLLYFAFRDYFISKGFETFGVSNFDGVRLVSPDAGALKKVFHAAGQIKYKNEVIIASKHRNIETGKIDYTNVPMSVNDADKDIFILDDIGDGFGTFIEITKVIDGIRKLSNSIKKENYGKNYLIVTHSIQKSGLERALNFFDKIYTTNSVNDWEIENLLVLNVF